MFLSYFRDKGFTDGQHQPSCSDPTKSVEASSYYSNYWKGLWRKGDDSFAVLIFRLRSQETCGRGFYMLCLIMTLLWCNWHSFFGRRILIFFIKLECCQNCSHHVNCPAWFATAKKSSALSSFKIPLICGVLRPFAHTRCMLRCFSMIVPTHLAFRRFFLPSWTKYWKVLLPSLTRRNWLPSVLRLARSIPFHSVLPF